MRSFSLLFVLALTVGVAAQTRTVTNNDLSQYREARLKAERDLRENYAKLGFPSPEELARRNAESARLDAELAERLRADERERARIHAERAAVSRYAESLRQANQTIVVNPGGYPVYYWSYGRRYRYDRPLRHYSQPGYFAGGQFWPTGSATRPQPLIRVGTPR
jgi:hypothetical protein